MMNRLVAVTGVAVVLALSASVCRAQTELEHERASLRGVDAFFLSVNVEGPGTLTARDDLAVPALRAGLLDVLRQAGLPVRADDAPPTARFPYLLVHLNLLDAGRGLVPFSIDLRFYQRVSLVRDPGQLTVAETWGTDLVGLVSYDQLPLLPAAAADAVRDFIDDFRRANAR